MIASGHPGIHPSSPTHREGTPNRAPLAPRQGPVPAPPPPAEGQPPPKAGDSIPVERCPRCQAVRREWVYNPYTRAAPTLNGWVLYASPTCDCPEHRQPRPWEERRADPELRWVDRQLNREAHRTQTFARFPRHNEGPVLRAALLFCQRYCRSYPPEGGPRGVYLAGPPSEARDWLLAAVTNAHRAHGVPTALVQWGHLLEIHGVGVGDEVLAGIVRRIQVLSLAGVLSVPATPLELKPVLNLLQARARRGLTTHVSSHTTPARLLTDRTPPERHPIHAELTAALGAACLQPVKLP